ncbi:MAG: peptidoglycan-binding protein [Gammaproteobacteria bacterium]|nr:peptidoglycan-binding protein [Gammaproteobacteria bacterium]
MESLKLGNQGPKVKRLQQELKIHGFNPGAIDGDFGPATEAALLNFQHSQGLIADGIAGPRTFKALGLSETGKTPNVIPLINSRLVSEMFPGAHIGAIKKNLPYVLSALEDVGLTEKPLVLMTLATVRAETAGFEPISEYISRYNTSPDGHPFDNYDYRLDIGNSGPPDGERYRGRGYVQLTGRDNYAVYGRNIGLGEQLLNEPERANEPDIAAKLLASFIKSKERSIKEALAENDFAAARKLVNGGRHGLDAFTWTYQKGESLLA